MILVLCSWAFILHFFSPVAWFQQGFLVCCLQEPYLCVYHLVCRLEEPSSYLYCNACRMVLTSRAVMNRCGWNDLLHVIERVEWFNP